MKSSKIDIYAQQIREALENIGKYSKSLETQIRTLAGTLVSLEVANNDIANLTSCVVDTPQGKKAHPAFRVRKEAEDSVTRQMKALGLNAEMLSDDIEDDPMVELTEKVIAAGDIKQKRITVKKR